MSPASINQGWKLKYNPKDTLNQSIYKHSWASRVKKWMIVTHTIFQRLTKLINIETLKHSCDSRVSKWTKLSQREYIVTDNDVRKHLWVPRVLIQGKIQRFTTWHTRCYNECVLSRKLIIFQLKTRKTYEFSVVIWHHTREPYESEWPIHDIE